MPHPTTAPITKDQTPHLEWQFTDPSIPALIEQLTETHPLPSTFADYQDHLISYLVDWQIEHPHLDCCLLLPWLRHFGFGLLRKLSSHLTADQLEQLSQISEIQYVPKASKMGRAYANKSRNLMRLAYLDVYLVLISLADHLAYLKIETQQAALEETQSVYLDLFKMFGFWGIRRDMIEETARKLDPVNFSRLQKQINDRQELYLEAKKRFSETLEEYSLRDQISVQSVLFRPPSPGRVLYRSKERNQPLREQLRSITIDLIAENETDCYRLLYIVHQIGIPIRGSFIDYITKPQFNGYSGLHTRIIFSDGLTSTLNLDVRIKTNDMEELNLKGFIHSKKRGADKKMGGIQWWDVPAQNKALIKFITHREIGEDVKEDSDIYVFSPSGEAHQIPKKFKAIDFAYHLHTEVGHHAEAIHINGLPAGYDSELTNGDLIKIRFNPLFPGPLPEWLMIAANNNTRRNIRNAIPGLAVQPTKSRQLLNKNLESLRNHSNFTIPPPALEKHLLSVADTLGYDHVEALFYDMDREPVPVELKFLSIERLISHILELELFRHINFDDGKPLLPSNIGGLSIFRPTVKFCLKCKPVPPSKIGLHVRLRKGKEVYTLHRAEPVGGDHYGLPRSTKTTCLDHIKPSENSKILTNIQWGDIKTNKSVFQLTIIAHDGAGLIKTVCEPIWNDSRVNLAGIEAQAEADGHAYISLIIEANSKERALNITKEIRNLPQVASATLSPVALKSSLHFQKKFGGLKNPYSFGTPVEQEHLFFGRQEEKEKIMSYLSADESIRLMIVHGHRRSGKTSFAQHIKNHRLDGLGFIAVYADLQIFQSFSDEVFYYELAYEIYQEFEERGIGILPPNRETFKSRPFRAFEEYLAVAQNGTSDRIILLCDEFNLLADNVLKNSGRDESRLFKQLRGITTSPKYKRITLVPIVHSSIYKLGLANRDMHDFYAQGPGINIKPLDKESARQLITRPMDGFIKYDQGTINQLISGTSGNPYLIHLLCFEIVERLHQEGRSLATLEDLNTAFHNTLVDNAETHFNFILRHISEVQNGWTVIKKIAEKQVDQLGWVDNVNNTIVYSAQIDGGDFRLIEHLINNNVLEAKNNNQQLRLSCGYFRDWVASNPNQFERAVKHIHE